MLLFVAVFGGAVMGDSVKRQSIFAGV